MSRLRHVNRSRKLKREARTLPIPGHIDYGDGKDNRKYYRCWNCGFTCDADRDKLGGPDDRPAVHPTSYTLLSDEVDSSGNATSLRGHEASANFLVGTAKGEGYTTVRYKSIVDSGCPLCGTLNWRGDHP